MPTPNDSYANTAKVSASVSMRTAVMLALFTVAGQVVASRMASSDDAVLRKLDELNTRVSRIEGALAPRVTFHGAEGAGGGTAAYSND